MQSANSATPAVGSAEAVPDRGNHDAFIAIAWSDTPSVCPCTSILVDTHVLPPSMSRSVRTRLGRQCPKKGHGIVHVARLLSPTPAARG